MIVKSFDLSKINIKQKNFVLFYGENEGLKKELIKDFIEKHYSKNIYRYDEKEITENEEKFFNGLNSKSFFENEKLIIISRVTDKINNIFLEILNKNYNDIKFVLIGNKLEKKSKIRNLFEKEKITICIPCYADTNQTIGRIITEFFKKKKLLFHKKLLIF